MTDEKGQQDSFLQILLKRHTHKQNTAPEFVLVSPDLSSSMANVVQPLAAAGHVTNVDMLEDREAQDVFE